MSQTGNFTWKRHHQTKRNRENKEGKDNVKVTVTYPKNKPMIRFVEYGNVRTVKRTNRKVCGFSGTVRELMKEGCSITRIDRSRLLPNKVHDPYIF